MYLYSYSARRTSTVKKLVHSCASHAWHAGASEQEASWRRSKSDFSESVSPGIAPGRRRLSVKLVWHASIVASSNSGSVVHVNVPKRQRWEVSFLLASKTKRRIHVRPCNVRKRPCFASNKPSHGLTSVPPIFSSSKPFSALGFTWSPCT